MDLLAEEEQRGIRGRGAAWCTTEDVSGGVEEDFIVGDEGVIVDLVADLPGQGEEGKAWPLGCFLLRLLNLVIWSLGVVRIRSRRGMRKIPSL